LCTRCARLRLFTRVLGHFHYLSPAYGAGDVHTSLRRSATSRSRVWPVFRAECCPVTFRLLFTSMDALYPRDVLPAARSRRYVPPAPARAIYPNPRSFLSTNRYSSRSLVSRSGPAIAFARVVRARRCTLDNRLWTQGPAGVHAGGNPESALFAFRQRPGGCTFRSPVACRPPLLPQAPEGERRDGPSRPRTSAQVNVAAFRPARCCGALALRVAFELLSERGPLRHPAASCLRSCPEP
jgi:hypothetical protein